MGFVKHQALFVWGQKGFKGCSNKGEREREGQTDSKGVHAVKRRDSARNKQLAWLVWCWW